MNLIDIVSLNDKEFQDYIDSLLLKGDKLYFSSLTERKYPLFFSYDKKSSYSFYQCVDNSFFCYTSITINNSLTIINSVPENEGYAYSLLSYGLIKERELYHKDINKFYSIHEIKEEGKTNENDDFNKLILSLNSTLGEDANSKTYSLIPNLSFSRSSFTLNLILNDEGNTYILKNVQTFLKNVNNDDFVSYTPSLAFYHNKKSFDNYSQKLINFLNNENLSFDEDGSLSLSLYELYSILIITLGKNIYINDVLTSVSKNIIEENINLDFPNKSIEFNPPIETKYHYYLFSNKGFIFDSNNNIIFLISFKSEKDQKLFTFFSKHPSFSLSSLDSDKFINFKDAYLSSNIKQDIYLINLYVSLVNDQLQLETKYFKNDFEIAKEDVFNEINFLPKIKNYLQTLEKLALKENLIISSQEKIIDVLRNELPLINKVCNVYLSDNLKNKTFVKTPSLKFSLNKENSLFTLSLDKTLDRNEIDLILSAYRQKKKFILYQNQIVLIDEDKLKQVEPLFESWRFTSLEKKELSFLDVLSLKEYPQDLFKFDKEVESLLKELKDFKNASFPLKENFKNTLKPYQKEGFNFLSILYKYHLNGILADDMGLGKTIQTIAFISSNSFSKPILIVSPKSIIYNWEKEFKTWNQDSIVKVVEGDKDQRNKLLSKLEPNTIYIASYDSLRNDLNLYQSHNYSLVILDEGQYIKNLDALKTKAVKSLKSDNKFVLTGTPIENSLVDLYSIFDFLIPSYLGSFASFKTNYLIPISENDEETKSKLKKKISPFILRRKKEDVLKELPKKIEEINLVSMIDEQEKLYKAYVSLAKQSYEERNNISFLSILTKLREICLDPSLFLESDMVSNKLLRSLEIIQNSIKGNHKVIIFSSFTTCLFHLQTLLNHEKIASYFIHGKTPSKTRLDISNKFNDKPDNVKVILVSLKAGGVGLNLIGGDIVILLDPWWNASSEQQAFDRAHRLGQKNNVTIFKLISKGTIEEKILLLQEQKKSLFEDYISSSDSSLSSLSSDDISFILS